MGSKFVFLVFLNGASTHHRLGLCFVFLITCGEHICIMDVLQKGVNTSSEQICIFDVLERGVNKSSHRIAFSFSLLVVQLCVFDVPKASVNKSPPRIASPWCHAWWGTGFVSSMFLERLSATHQILYQIGSTLHGQIVFNDLCNRTWHPSTCVHRLGLRFLVRTIGEDRLCIFDFLKTTWTALVMFQGCWWCWRSGVADRHCVFDELIFGRYNSLPCGVMLCYAMLCYVMLA